MGYQKDGSKQAIVRDVRRTVRLSQVEAYLPRNYTAWQDGEGGDIYIEGHDNAGWTLEGYVIPRLASGLIWAEAI